MADTNYLYPARWGWINKINCLLDPTFSHNKRDKTEKCNSSRSDSKLGLKGELFNVGILNDEYI